MIKTLLIETTLMARLQNPVILVGIGLAIIGVSLALLAKKVTKAVRKTPEIESNDKILIGMKAVGLVLVLVALILISFSDKIVL